MSTHAMHWMFQTRFKGIASLFSISALMPHPCTHPGLREQQKCWRQPQGQLFNTIPFQANLMVYSTLATQKAPLCVTSFLRQRPEQYCIVVKSGFRHSIYHKTIPATENGSSRRMRLREGVIWSMKVTIPSHGIL